MFGRTIEFAKTLGLPYVIRACTIVAAEGRGYIWANDGQAYREPTTPADRTLWNWNGETGMPIGTPQWRASMREVCRLSLSLPHDKVGRNGASVGPTQAIPTEAARLYPRPWGGWGTVRQCMDVEYIVPKMLAQLADVKLTTDPVRDCWQVQRWLAPDPAVDLDGFHRSPETLNYTRVMTGVRAMLDVWHPAFFTDGGKLE